MSPATASLVVAWRHAEVTFEAVDSLLLMEPAPDRLVCVVQEWRPDELDTLRSILREEDLVLAHDENLGYSHCANEGVERALGTGAEYVLILNNDATVTKDCLAELLADADGQPGAAAIGPAVAFSDEPELIWFAGGAHSHRFAVTRHPHLRERVDKLPPSGPTDYIPGCCLLLRREAWQAVGPYREDYFLYYEDAEWCDRAKAAGWSCRFLAKVLCYHQVSVSSGLRGSIGLSETNAYYLARNPLRYALETKPPPLKLTRLFGVVCIWGTYNLQRIVRSRSFKVGRAYLIGSFDALRGRMGRR